MSTSMVSERKLMPVVSIFSTKARSLAYERLGCLSCDREHIARSWSVVAMPIHRCHPNILQGTLPREGGEISESATAGVGIVSHDARRMVE